MQLVAKGLLGGTPERVSVAASVVGKDRRAGEAEQVITLEDPSDLGMHVTELTAMAFVENHHHMRFIDRVFFVLRHEAAELLDGGDNDARVLVFQLPLQYGSRRVGVGRAFFKSLVLAHGLVIQILAIHHKQHLVDIRQAPRQLRRLETGQRLAAAGGVPDVTACGCLTQLTVIGTGRDALQNLLCRHDLIGPHNQ